MYLKALTDLSWKRSFNFRNFKRNFKQKTKKKCWRIKFGDASSKVVIEEHLNGIELSVFVLTDGFSYKNSSIS